jgi:hypothetical protein
MIRLLTRHKRADVPSIAEEEKMRQRVAHIPKFVSNLKRLISDFEKGQDQPVKIGVQLLGGSTTSEGLERNEQEHEDKIQRERKQRKQHAGGSSLTSKTAAKRPMGSKPLQPKN